MLKASKLQPQIILLLLSILLGASSLNTLVNSNLPLGDFVLSLRYILVGLSLLCLLFLSRSYQSYFPKTSLPLLLLWLAFSYTSVMSSVYNADIFLLAESLWSLIGIPIIFFIKLPALLQANNGNRLIAWALIISQAPYLLLSLLINPTVNYPYQGVFANPNQVGVVSATVAAGAFTWLADNITSRKSSLSNLSVLFGILFLLLSSLVLTLFSGSRTSLISFFTMTLVFATKLLLNQHKLSKLIKFLTVASPFAILSVILLSASDVIRSLLDEVFLRSIFKNGSTSDVLSGRSDIWEKTIEQMTVLGHGKQYFDAEFGIGAHNSIVLILGCNGVLAAMFMVCFALVSIFYAFRYMIAYADRDCCSIAPLMITACFWTLSMGEEMFGSLGRGITLAYILTMGIAMTSRYNRSQKEPMTRRRKV